MKERIAAIIGTITGTGTTALGASIDTVMLDSTPYLKYITMLFGSLLSIVMFIYWLIKIYEKLFKKDKP